MKRTKGLWMGLLLLGLTNGEIHIQQHIVFSEGIQLFVQREATNGSLGSKEPVVHVFLPSVVETATSNTVTLVCFVRGLLLGFVDITWKINNTAVTTGEDVTQASRETDGTFTAIGILFIDVEEWNPRNNYRCAASQGGKVYQGSAQASSCWGMAGV